MKKLAIFLESIYFIIFTNIFTIICWYLEKPTIAYMAYLLFLILIIISKTKRYVISMLILTAMINYQMDTGVDGGAFKTYLLFFLPFAAIAIIILIVDIIIRKPKFRLSGILYGFIVLLFANILSMINIKEKAVLEIAIIGILQLFGFTLLFIYIDFSKDGTSKTYLSKTALVLSSAITIELLLHYLKIGGVVDKSSHNLSWGVSNVIAMFYLVLIPLGLFLYYNNQKNHLVLPLSGINFFMLVFMLSRGAFLTLAIIIIPILICSFFLVKSKLRLIVDLTTTLTICLIVGLIFASSLGLVDAMKDYVKNIDFTDGNGRMQLYEIGLTLFKENPVFGAGSYSGAFYLKEHSVGTYHNYIIQALATTGAFGLIALIYFSFEIIKAAFKKDIFNICFLFSRAAILIHGLVDNTFYNPIIMIFLAAVLPLLDKNLLERKFSEEVVVLEENIE